MTKGEEAAELETETKSALMSSHMSARSQRIEVITRGERRRRWSIAEKREIAAESLEPGVSPITVVRRHGISSSQLYTWRRQLLEGSLASTAQPVAQFARAELTTTQVPPALADGRPEPGVSVPSPPSRPGGMIEIILPSGVSVRVDTRVDSGALRRVLTALTVR
jgi:transposase